MRKAYSLFLFFVTWLFGMKMTEQTATEKEVHQPPFTAKKVMYVTRHGNLLAAKVVSVAGNYVQIRRRRHQGTFWRPISQVIAA